MHHWNWRARAVYNVFSKNAIRNKGANQPEHAWHVNCCVFEKNNNFFSLFLLLRICIVVAVAVAVVVRVFDYLCARVSVCASISFFFRNYLDYSFPLASTLFDVLYGIDIAQWCVHFRMELFAADFGLFFFSSSIKFGVVCSYLLWNANCVTLSKTLCDSSLLYLPF